MKRVTFNGPSALLVVDDKRIARGDSELLANETAERLEANERIDVTVESESKPAPASAAAKTEAKEE